ncbi:MAG: carbohydrate kinase [Chloroflexi bacterium]|nr:carbohydrate kinase [Chloroflexota bacterium]
MMDEAQLNALFKTFNHKHILVVGDYFLDKYLQLDRTLDEVSLETGLSAHQVTGIVHSPGAAGNVAANVRALGPQVTAISILGDDGEGYDLRRQLEEREIGLDGVLTSRERFTPTYTKPMMHEPDSTVHELERLDHKNRTPLPAELENALIAKLTSLVDSADAIVIADQVQERNCGVLSERVRGWLVGRAQQRRDLLMVVDSRLRVGEYRYMTLKPNERELLNAFGEVAEDEVSIAQASQLGLQLAARNEARVCVTCGSRGMIVCERRRAQRVPAIKVEGPIDIVGAGDTALASLACALSAGLSMTEAAWLANLAASVTIRQIGTTGVCTPVQLRNALTEARQGP